jgi:hypothetical protein
VNRTPRRKSRSRSRSIPSSPSDYEQPQYSSSLTLSDEFSSFALRDDGCLGGF